MQLLRTITNFARVTYWCLASLSATGAASSWITGAARQRLTTP
ncbi:hypothetical protein [Klebsiella phage pKP-M212-2.1]|nr:hypothetical protein [Klebsiella phage pKP-M212-2.1]